MATHSSVLAWRILGTGEPGGLPSMGSHRVGTCKDVQEESTGKEGVGAHRGSGAQAKVRAVASAPVQPTSPCLQS